ncbi:polysaccharide biosynthesis/export family protein [Flavobacterium sp.]|uniref:polysaccharide biosynthesis/export family protein n=1 Tax=Flavobacterium sp. TaxID=239 RepID=UPI00286DACB9|nr:polysaccharide biosynthesis/export family protein [Flavobacterium sp.]
MEKSIFYKFFVVLILIFCFTSCKSTKKIAYYQNLESLNTSNTQVNFESTIQSDDLLMIVVSAMDQEAAAAFNLETIVVPTPIGQGQLAQRQQQLYLVDNLGNIEFPVLGSINIKNKTKSEIIILLKQKLSTYIKNPIVNIRIMNYKVTIQGEVLRPGSYPISSERITLPEALSLAGDLTIYGKRDNIILIRETNGKKSYNIIDITKPDFINSPFYYMSQNDLIYVEPNKAKKNTSTGFNQNIPVIIAVLSLVTSAIFSIIAINQK